MTTTSSPSRAGLAARWPTAAGIVGSAAAIALIVRLDRDGEFFGPVVVMMAGVYLFAFALGRPWTVWIASVVLSAVVSLLQVLYGLGALPVDPAVAMSIVVALLWLWTAVRRRSVDRATFGLETAGAVAFGSVTLACAAVEPRWGALLAGFGFLSHGIWDAYHFRMNKVVHRTYAEFCGVVDLVVGPALIIAGLAS